MNHAFERMFMCSRDEAVGRSAMDFTTAEYRPLIMAKIDDRSEEPYEAVGLRIVPVQSGSRTDPQFTFRTYVQGKDGIAVDVGGPGPLSRLEYLKPVPHGSMFDQSH